jgi:hypothetical protein
MSFIDLPIPKPVPGWISIARCNVTLLNLLSDGFDFSQLVTVYRIDEQGDAEFVWYGEDRLEALPVAWSFGLPVVDTTAGDTE